MAERHVVSINEAAAIFGYSWKTIARMIDQGGAPAVYRGHHGKEAQIDTVAFLRWMIEQENSREQNEFKRAKLGKLQQEEIALRLENERHLAELVPAGDVRDMFGATHALLAEALEGVPARVAEGNKSLCRRVEAEFGRILGTVRQRFSKYDRP